MLREALVDLRNRRLAGAPPVRTKERFKAAERLREAARSPVEELFRDIPAGVRLGRDLALERQLSEAELFAHMGELAARNDDFSLEMLNLVERQAPLPAEARR